MIKKWFAEALAILISASSIGQLHGEIPSQNPPVGKEIVAEVEASYASGNYGPFLSQLHEQYETAGQAGALRGLFESAKSAIHASTVQKIEEQIAAKQQELAKLSKQRDQRLLEVITADPNLTIADRIDTVVFYDLSSDYADVLAELDRLKYEVPETAIGSIDNKISALETEYYMKELLLNVASHRRGETAEDFEQKKMAIRLEKLDKMHEAAIQADDKIWIEKMEMAKRAFRAQMAFKLDFDALKALADGRTSPKNPIEEKVKQIMMDFQTKKKEILDQSSTEIASN